LDSIASADLIVEAITEDRGAKRELFRAIDRLAPADAILASNTSAIPITDLAAATSRPAQVAGMHFMNPVPLMPLVEIIRSRQTSDDTLAAIHEVTKTLGKVGVEAADTPGFIANRVLMPMINEAALALAEGVGSAEAIDQVMTLGMRHPMGPLALADLIGIDVCVAILEVLEEGLGNAKYRPCALLKEMVAGGRLGRKSGQGFYSYKKAASS
jgi:3-hydroxybutyryl-CoA dehydrogenase